MTSDLRTLRDQLVQDVVTRLEELIRSLHRWTQNLIVHSVPQGADEDQLRALGVSHVSYREILEPGESPRSELTPDGWARASAV